MLLPEPGYKIMGDFHWQPQLPSWVMSTRTLLAWDLLPTEMLPVTMAMGCNYICTCMCPCTLLVALVCAKTVLVHISRITYVAAYVRKLQPVQVVVGEVVV